jgi:hypothetical protein
MLALTTSPAVAGGSGSSSSSSPLLGHGSGTVTPAQNLTVPQSLAVNLTGIYGTSPGDEEGGGFAVTLCGNVDANGVPAASFAALAASDQFCSNTPTGGGLQLPSVTGGAISTTITYNTSVNRSSGSPAQCTPRVVGGQPCFIQIVDIGSHGGNTGVTPTSFRLFIPIYANGSAASPTLATTAVTNQSNASAGRSGNVITLGGANWQTDATSSDFTVKLCADAGAVSCDAAFATQSATADGSNALGGSATIPAGATAGNRFLVVSNPNGDSASEPFHVLGTPTVNLSPPAGGPGTPVTVTGTNFDTGRPLNAFGTNTGVPLTAISTGTADSNGNISAGLVVTVNSNLAVIAVLQGSSLASPDLYPGTSTPISGNHSFAFSNTSCIPAGSGPDDSAATANGCSLLQTINETVTGTTLTFSEAGSNVTLSGVTLNGSDQTATGAIQPLTVLDARGSLSGWTVLATMGNLTDGTAGASPANHHAIPAGNLSTSGVACAPHAVTTGVASDVSVGAGGSLDPTTAITLCTAIPGGGGGTFDISSNLSLVVPASVAAGHYTATMTLLVT